MKTRGASLLMALLVLSLGTVIVFSLASLSTVQLRTSEHSEQQDHARNLAESAIYLGIDQICRSAAYGTHSEILNVPASGYEVLSTGNLTFDFGRAQTQGIHCSFNNLGSKQARNSPEGRNVPGETCLLVGSGVSGSARVQIECMYYRPAFPTGLVTGAAMEATDFSLNGMMPGVDFLGNLAAQRGDLHPVDLHSNASLKLQGHCDISGDVSAVATVGVGADSRVRGEVREHIAAQTIPRLDIQQIRQDLVANGVEPLTLGSSVGGVTVNWYTEASGPLEISGNLNLDGGLLYVPGWVRVHGRVQGRGALLARGPITVDQGNDLSDRDLTILASESDVTLQGAGKYFHGLVYSGGKLTAHDMTVVGSVVCQGAGELTNSALIQTEVATRMVIGRPVRSANHDDVFFWYVNRGEPDPVTREPRYDYFMGIYIDAYTSSFNGSPNFQTKNRNRTRAQVEAELLAFADTDYQPVDDLDPAPVIRGSVMLAGPLSNYLNQLDAAGATTVNFDLNKLLTPIQTSRVLLWRRCE
ncbi:MAG: hypothetical protein KF760_21215 [Candidatus Eremiobacteraeota bacterium]|nr:hypothetical protein [Candidatus Eremiobacteraeota bacterium]MCW5867283.1 hypothetical protein [Candidatus Eremiobacteraeota bacterium]